MVSYPTRDCQIVLAARIQPGMAGRDQSAIAWRETSLVLRGAIRVLKMSAAGVPGALGGAET